MCARAILAILTASALFAVSQISAQPSSSSLPAHKPAHLRKHTESSAAQPAPQPAPAEQTVPRPPNWPVNDPPAQATVVWDSHGLRIQAANSSLEQILNEVSAETGAKVQGFGKDERIFGNYGPGNTSDVLAQLLDGSGYNLLIIGGQAARTPLQVVLTARTGGAPETVVQDTQTDADDANVDEQPQEPQPPPPPVSMPMQPHAFSPGQPPRTPQQIMQEMQQRQQQIGQQQNNPQY